MYKNKSLCWIEYLYLVHHQVFQLQQEKKKLQEDFSSLLQDRETLEKRCATIQREQTQLGPRLEETKWEVGLCQRLNRFTII